MPVSSRDDSATHGTTIGGDPLPRPDRLFVATVGVQWIVTVGVALSATRTGSLYGDPATASAAVAAAQSVTDGALPATAGPLFPLLLAPLTGVTSNLDTVASVVTTLSVLLLAPVASYCLLDVARRIAGWPFAAAAAAVWLLGPILVVPLFVSKYRETYVDAVLPALYGLTIQPAFLAMVLSLVAAAFCLRAVAGSKRAGLVAGLAAAAAIACVPVAAGIGAGVVIALAVARRWRGLAEASVGLATAVFSTLAWRHRIPGVPTFTLGDPSWTGFQSSMAGVREFFWSNRLLQWATVAGAAGMYRVAPPAAALAASWAAVATLLGVATAPTFDRGAIFLDLIPAWPAFALLVAAIPSLVPTLVRRFRSHLAADASRTSIPRSAAAAAFVIAALVPAALVLLVGR